jgi:apolipoprotein N-acyltransferase
MRQIADLLPEGTVLITGAIRAPEAPSGERVSRAYNSVYIIDHDGSILGIYDKVHLVPFGEYLPFQPVLERIGLMQLTKVIGGFIPGDRHRAMTVPRAPTMIPLICYEAIFPGEAVPEGQRPGWLINVTNDAWFGISSGPYQHFQQARVLAIAHGLPMVRAANNGISAVIDPLGRVVRQLPLGAEGIVDARLPQPLAPTVFVQFGDYVFVAMLVAGLLMVMRRKLRDAL